MKRTLIASILGIAASVASSYGQGQIIFSTYISSGAIPNMVWGDTKLTPPTHAIGTALTAADNFTATLYYGLGSGLSFGSLAPVAGSATAVGTLFAGAVVGPTVLLPGWSAGTAVTFGIHIDNGPGGYASLDNVTWTEPYDASGLTGVVGTSLPANQFSAALLNAAYPTGFAANPVPEPTTMALAGLGAAAMVIFRRRK